MLCCLPQSRMLSGIARLSILIISLLVGGSLNAAEVRESVDWQRSFLDQYCVACHNDVVREANFTLQSIALDQVGTHLEEVGTWEKVVLKLRAREMPGRLRLRFSAGRASVQPERSRVSDFRSLRSSQAR